MVKGFEGGVVILNTIVREPPLLCRTPANQCYHQQLVVKMEVEDHHQDLTGKMWMEAILENNCVERNDFVTRPRRPARQWLRRGEGTPSSEKRMRS